MDAGPTLEPLGITVRRLRMERALTLEKTALLVSLECGTTASECVASTARSQTSRPPSRPHHVAVVVRLAVEQPKNFN